MRESKPAPIAFLLTVVGVLCVVLFAVTFGVDCVAKTRTVYVTKVVVDDDHSPGDDDDDDDNDDDEGSIGACCWYDGMDNPYCAQETAAQCLSQAREWMGVISCDVYPCGDDDDDFIQPCCYKGNCAMGYADNCAGWLPPAISCDPNPCMDDDSI